MKFSTLVLGIATARLATCSYYINYYKGTDCSGDSVQCSGLGASGCCGPPQRPEEYSSVWSSSDGEDGKLVFSEMAFQGGCSSECTSVKGLNNCYRNGPDNWKPTYVANYGDTCDNIAIPNHKRHIAEADSKQPEPECKGKAGLDTAIVNGQQYDLTGPDRLAIMDDMLDLDHDAFAAKWVGVHSGPRRQHGQPSHPAPLPVSDGTVL